jgi:hypothetical protein
LVPFFIDIQEKLLSNKYKLEWKIVEGIVGVSIGIVVANLIYKRKDGKNGKDIKIHSKQLYVFLDSLFPIRGASDKHIPREYLSYHPSILVKLFNSMISGDGNVDGSRYTTASKTLADQFQELCVLIGKSASIIEEGDSLYRITIRKSVNPSFGDMRSKKLNCSKERYTGFVYDVTVKNHIIYVRRNGKACWGSNCYGRKQNIWDKYRNVLGIWMYQSLNDEPMTIFGDGSQTRAFSCMDDICAPLWSAGFDSQASKEIINLGGIHKYSINESIDIISDVMGYDNILRLETRHEPKHSVPTYQKSIDLLDFEHTVNLDEGLKDMWEWAKKQPMRERYVWPSYEIDKGIYSYWKV